MQSAITQLLDTVPTGETRQVPATLAGAHLAALTDAQVHALQAALARTNHTVHVGRVTRPTLRALARKGYGTLNYQPGMGRRRIIESLTLNSRGIREAEHQQVLR